jgi:hypothetical protein
LPLFKEDNLAVKEGPNPGWTRRGGRVGEADSRERKEVLPSFCLHFVLFRSRDYVNIHTKRCVYIYIYELKKLKVHNLGRRK